jgi:hypothetical protein
VRIARLVDFILLLNAEQKINRYKWNPWYLLSGGGEAVYSFWKTVSHFFFPRRWLVGGF